MSQENLVSCSCQLHAAFRAVYLLLVYWVTCCRQLEAARSVSESLGPTQTENKLMSILRAFVYFQRYHIINALVKTMCIILVIVVALNLPHTSFRVAQNSTVLYSVTQLFIRCALYTPRYAYTFVPSSRAFFFPDRLTDASNEAYIEPGGHDQSN